MFVLTRNPNYDFLHEAIFDTIFLLKMNLPNNYFMWPSGKWKVEIKCEVLKSTKFVVLHSKNLNISKARVTTLPSNDVNEAHIRMKNDTDQLFLMLDESIPKDTEILITIVFHGILEVMAGKGFYLSEYLENNNEKRWD